MCAVLLLACSVSTHPAAAAMSLLRREMFASTGQIDAASPGNFTQVFGTLRQRAGGPRLADGTAASADPQGSQAAGLFDIASGLHTKVFVGGWFYIDQLALGQSWLLSVGDSSGNAGPVIYTKDGALGAGVPFLSWTACPTAVTNRWIYLGIAISHRGQTNADVKFYYRLPGGELTSWAAFTDGNVWIRRLDWVRLAHESNSVGSRYRVGAPSVSQFQNSDFSDVIYPPDVIDPVRGLTWYCNPATGNDNNDGTTPETAWATVAKINTESQNLGMFPTPTTAEGDTLIIDTSGAPLEAPGTALALRTAGLTVRAAPGQEWIRIKSYRTLAASFWTPSGVANVYATSDTQPTTVAWEDDKFMHHPTGPNFSAVAAALSATPGSFWTDGTTLYLHPFGSTDPRGDGKRYERSYLFDEAMPVALAAPNLHVRDIHVGKTCLAAMNGNSTIQNYCMGSRSEIGNSVIEHCHLYYGSNHLLGLVHGSAGDVVTIEGVRAEQGSPYVASGGQTVWVSFTSGPSNMGIVHRYRNCSTKSNAGLAGSTEGIMRGDLPVFYSHNAGGANQYARFEFTNCDFGDGPLHGDAVQEVRLTNTRCSLAAFVANVTLDQCTLKMVPHNFTGKTLRATNCVFELRGIMGANPAAGPVEMRACTFDASAVTAVQQGVPYAGLFTRAGPVALTLHNNIFIMPPAAVGANVFSLLRGTDALDLGHNAYQLSGGVLSYRFEDGAGTADRTLSEWQALGYDTTSFESTDLLLAAHQPLPGSPVVDAGLDLGPLADHSGQVHLVRDDIGAYEAPIDYPHWRAKHFSAQELEQPEVSGPTAVAGWDGVANLLKFAFGLAPRDDATGALPVFGYAGANLCALTYNRLRQPHGLTYNVETSADLKFWKTAPVTSEQSLGADSLTERVRAEAALTGPDQPRFARLRISLTESNTAPP